MSKKGGGVPGETGNATRKGCRFATLGKARTVETMDRTAALAAAHQAQAKPREAEESIAMAKASATLQGWLEP